MTVTIAGRAVIDVIPDPLLTGERARCFVAAWKQLKPKRAVNATLVYSFTFHNGF